MTGDGTNAVSYTHLDVYKRQAWADVTNRHLETTGHEERIDHRSHADRGLTEDVYKRQHPDCETERTDADNP